MNFSDVERPSSVAQTQVQSTVGAAVEAEIEQRPARTPDPTLPVSWPRPLPVDDDHRPAEPAAQPFITDPAVLRARLSELLASDPETLEEVRQMLDERDPSVLSENLRVLNDAFAIE